VHGSQALDDLLDKSDKGQPLYADSAYTGEKQKKVIRKYRLKNQVTEKGYRGKPLTDKQKAKNKVKSKTRARVEHVLNSLNIGCTSTKSKQVWFCIRFAQYFGFMEQSMNGLVVRSVGLIRATGIIGLIHHVG
jgi:IS5 family transposase